MAHWYVLNNCEEVQPYIEECEEELKRDYQNNIELEKRFPQWFKKKIHHLWNTTSNVISDQLFALACGPNLRVWKYKGCIVNGVRFLVKDRDNRRQSQNSGITCEGEHDGKSIDFYGLINGIIKIEYGKGFNVFIFSCEWFDLANRRMGIRKDTHFTSVNISGTWYRNDPYILASQAKQVFFVDDLKLGGNWKIVQRFNHRHVFDVPEDEMDEIAESTPNDVVNLDDDSPDSDIVIEDREIGPMDRVDVDPETINSSVLRQKSKQNNTENNILFDEDIDDNVDEDAFEEDEFDEEGYSEDDTHVEYLSEEERSMDKEDDD